MSKENIVSGYLYFIQPIEQNIDVISRKNNASELASFQNAIIKVKSDITMTKKSIDPSMRVFWEILEFYELAVEDYIMVNTIKDFIIHSQLTAESAVNLYFDRYLENLQTKDAYFRSRSHDFIELKNRLLTALSSSSQRHISIDNPSKKPIILVFDTVYPYELSQIDLTYIVGVISLTGSLHSHVAIILASMKIPYFINPTVKTDFHHQDLVVVDVNDGQISLTNQLTKNHHSINHEVDQKTFKHHQIELHPAINLMSEIPHDIPPYWTSIGLYRTEFFFMDKNYLPDEIEQYLHYREVCQKAQGKRVLFRLLDVEPDKPLRSIKSNDYGIEFLLKNQTLLAIQLKALLSVSKDYPIGITVPMITNNEAIEKVKDSIQKIRNIEAFWECQLDYHFGIMVERKDALKNFNSLVGFDYILLGTNDLSAEYGDIDRLNQNLKNEIYLNSELQKDIVTLIKDTEYRKILTILCGDGANIKEVIRVYYNHGIRHFAPSPKNINNYDIFF